MVKEYEVRSAESLERIFPLLKNGDIITYHTRIIGSKMVLANRVTEDIFRAAYSIAQAGEGMLFTRKITVGEETLHQWLLLKVSLKTKRTVELWAKLQHM